MTDTENQRAGFAAIIGAPNAGKSTLVNALVGQKVAIVSPKAQTTRARIMGIAIEGDAQILLVDTPGIFAPKRRLDRAMVSAAWEGAQSADAIALLVDPVKQRRHELEPLIEALKDRPERKLLVLNKVDASAKEPLLALDPIALLLLFPWWIAKPLLARTIPAMLGERHAQTVHGPRIMRLHAAFGATHDLGGLRSVQSFPGAQQKRLLLPERQILHGLEHHIHVVGPLQQGDRIVVHRIGDVLDRVLVTLVVHGLQPGEPFLASRLAPAPRCRASSSAA